MPYYVDCPLDCRLAEFRCKEHGVVVPWVRGREFSSESYDNDE